MKKYKAMNKNNLLSTKVIGLLITSASLFGCASNDVANDSSQNQQTFTVSNSYLEGKQARAAQNTTVSGAEIATESNKSTMQPLQVLPNTTNNKMQSNVISAAFSDKPSLTVAVEEMPVVDFLHYAFGELLDVNYVIEETVSKSNKHVTLNIGQAISQRRLVELTTELLIKNDLQLSVNNGLYFIHQIEQGNKGKVIIALGGGVSDVPQTAQEILQVVPLKYGIRISVERTLRQLVGVEITPDFEQSALYLKGKRENIIRALDLINLLDVPANRGSHIGLINLTYLTGKEFTAEAKKLLENEGIPVSIDTPDRKNVVMVPIAQIGAVAVFSTDELMLQRVRYWAQLIDKPSKGNTKRYFVYHPQFARAADIGASLTPLIGGLTSQPLSPKSNNAANKNSTGSAPSAKRSVGASNDQLSMVVDERANSIIFHASGSAYQSLQPLIKQLDILPRQVMLDISIAEVSLKDEFKHGVEFAFNQGDVKLTTQGAFGVGKIGGFGAVLTGTSGSINANFLQTNQLIKVLSNPTLLVRDGVTANIKVGTKISVAGAATTDPNNGVTVSSEYRETGVNVTVTPTINAQGIVIMEIDQAISNQVPDSSGAGGNPDIFDRSLKTEVVAQSGQTIILGGLISEDGTKSNQKTPWMADIPILGYLFKSKGDSQNRTELIMLITPRVVDTTEQWTEVTDSFKQELNFLKVKS